MSLSVRVDSNKYIVPMRQALERCDISKVLHLIQEGADINFPDEDGWSPLHVAAKIGNVKIIKLLVESGADIKLLNKPFTVLDEQIYAGIEYNPVENNFQTALDIAKEYNKREAIELLEKYEHEGCSTHSENDISLYCLT